MVVSIEGELPPTERQRELLTLIAVEGLTVKEAAARMSISEGTARKTMTELRIRLGAKHTANAVIRGLNYIIGGAELL